MAVTLVAVTVVLNAALVLFIAFSACDESVQALSASRETYCDLFRSPTDLEVLASAALLYGPSVSAVVAATVALVRRSARLVSLGAIAVGVWLAALALPLVVT